MQKVKPKKALGQHFLTDLSVARRIAATLSEYRNLPVVEVGPGMGVLTQFLISEGHDLKVAEIDGESVEYLRENYPELAAEGRIIEGDFLKMDLAELFPGHDKFCVIGNYSCNLIPFRVLPRLNCDRIIPCIKYASKNGTIAGGIRIPSVSVPHIF